MIVLFPNGRTVEAEVARTPEQQRVGMLKYDHPPKTAMLFPYERQTDVTYTMRGMKFPLDVCFLQRVAEQEYRVGDEVVAKSGLGSEWPVARGDRLRVTDVGAEGNLVLQPLDSPLNTEVYAKPWQVRRASAATEDAVMRYTTGDIIRMTDEMVGQTQGGPVELHEGERYVVKQVWPNVGQICIYRADGIGGGAEIMLRVSSRVCPACLRLKSRCKGATACYRAAAGFMGNRRYVEVMYGPIRNLYLIGRVPAADREEALGLIRDEIERDGGTGVHDTDDQGGYGVARVWGMEEGWGDRREWMRGGGI